MSSDEKTDDAAKKAAEKQVSEGLDDIKEGAKELWKAFRDITKVDPDDPNVKKIKKGKDTALEGLSTLTDEFTKLTGIDKNPITALTTSMGAWLEQRGIGELSGLNASVDFNISLKDAATRDVLLKALNDHGIHSAAEGMIKGKPAIIVSDLSVDEIKDVEFGKLVKAIDKALPEVVAEPKAVAPNAEPAKPGGM